MHTLEIKEYQKYLIIKINQFTPKLQNVGIGLSLINFNKHDLLISNEALHLLKDYHKKSITKQDEPVLEIISSNNLWFLSTTGLIIPPDEIIHIYTIPYYTLTDNHIDTVLKNKINQNIV